MIFLRVLILLLLLVLCPFLIGMLSFRFLPRNRQSVAITFVTGQLLSFALFEVIAVTCMLLNRYDSFVFTYRIYLAGMVFFTAFGARDLILRLRRVGVLQLFPGDHFPEPEALMDPYRDITDYKQRYTKEAILYWVLFFVLLFFQLYMLFTQASFDGDDAYYVTESVLAQQTGTMNRILPYTGISTTLDIRHALSVITMWTAFLAKASGIHAAIVAHTVLPLFFLIFTDLVLMESGRILVRGRQNDLPVFMVFLALLQIFGNNSIYTPETFLMTRTWQGKSVMANAVVALTVYVFLMLLENTIRLQRLTERRRKDKNSKRERYAPFILLTLVNLLAQISTSMGVVLLTGLIMLLSFFFLLYTKKIRSVIPAFLCCLPNVFYILLYLFYRGA